ncbi:two-component regulator propeller domain-containing protein [Tamlana sp. s12]|uniref:two-component regulator propeller domain-containing protein n=1 Tax=Tamlana sp. s12 TaxID=1630406 RepID=UPI000B176FB9|nr:two-component regulator propeller domain-containing protein [Tamlana sp. s12]
MKPHFINTIVFYAIFTIGVLSVQWGFSQNIKTQKTLDKQFAFKALTIEHGLSQNCVISIAQDSIGYLWLATQDGLNKYDGREFKYYDKQFEDKTRSRFSKLGKVYIDNQNKLWLITYSGKLEYYHPKTDTFISVKTPYGINSIYQDSKNDLYLGTYNHGVIKINPSTKETTELSFKDLNNQTVYEFLETNNSLFMATSHGVFNYSEASGLKRIDVDHTNQCNYSTLAATKDGTLWLGSYGDGIFYKPPHTQEFKKFYHDNVPNNINVEDLLVDSKNRLWIATYGDGIFLINHETQEAKNFKANKSNPFAIHYNDMLCLFEDKTGVVWYGSDGTGANYYDEHLIKFNILTNNQVPHDINVDMVRCINTDALNNVWIGTSGKGLTCFNLKNLSYKTFTENNSTLSSNRIISLNDFDHELWIGHQVNGLNILNNSGVFINYPELSKHTIWRILAETKDRRWLCTESGIVLFDKNLGILKTYNQSNSSLPINNVRAIVKENDSIIWAGTDNAGVYRINTKTDEIKEVKQLHYKIKTLFIKNGVLWIGSNGSGLIKYNIKENTLITYKKEDGLPNNVVYGILEGTSDDLWLSTNNGLSRFSTSKSNGAFENFSADDGLQGSEFNTGAYFKSEDGTLFFGGLEGINWFKPNELTYNKVKPKTIISSFEVFSKNREMTNNLELKHNENTISFTFSSLHFSSPERSTFKYKLENHDENWVISKNFNLAHYTNLPPNTYTFKVISSNYDGVWNESPAKYTFKINKPWYLSVYAIIFYNIIFILLSYLVYYLAKVRWHMKMQLQFENTETNRLKKLDEYKTKLYTNISHEIRTPLTLILGPITNQLNKAELAPKDKKELNLVKQNANRLLNLVDQMLNLSMIDSGQIKLKVAQGNLGLLLKQIANAFQYHANKNDLKIVSKIHNLNDVWYDSDMIEKICSNLLSNAIKYATKKTDIIFEANRQDSFLVLSVINSSEQIGEKDLSLLFQRFYQNNEMSDGVGVGLALVRDLVNLSKGTIVANSLGNNRIQFTVSLPINKEAFNESDFVCSETTPKNSIIPNIKHKETSEDTALILVVEDDIDILEFTTSIFKNEYQISKASNGQEAFQKAIKTNPDIIISDIMMPIKNGIDLCESIKNNPATSHIPVVLLTAKVGEQHEIEGLKTGADAYITKPFNSDKLKIIIRNLLENRKQVHKHFSETLSISPKLAVSSTESEFLKHLQEVIDTNVTNPEFNSEMFASKMALSRTQLHRKLKAITNTSTSEFIRLQRLKIAKELLKQSDVTVAEVGYQAGFNTPSYFIKCFKEVYACTPHEYIDNPF